MVKPHLYFDTCILLDAIYNRRQSSSVLLAQASEEVKKNNWLCSTSRWTIIELFDQLQEERYVEILRIKCELWSSISRKVHNIRHDGLAKPELDLIWNKLHGLITQDYSFIQVKYPKTDKMWDKAEDYCSGTNIGSTDALHLASAIEIGCNIFVTNDKATTTIANQFILTVPPSDVDLAIATISPETGLK